MMRLPWIEDCENCGFVPIFLLLVPRLQCEKIFSKRTKRRKRLRHDNHQLLRPITNQNNKNNCDKLMTRRRIESLNISRSQEGAAEGIFRFDSKAKMMMKKISIFTRCLSSKQRDHWSWNLEIKWNFTLYSYQLKRPVEAKKSRVLYWPLRRKEGCFSAF